MMLKSSIILLLLETYTILFSVVTFSTYFIPNCSIMNQHAVYIGLLAATTFVLLDKYYPSIVINKEEHI